MSASIQKALVAIGIAASVAAIFAAIYLIFKGEKPIIIIPYNQTCSSDPECQVASMPTCADCWTCNDATKRCAYSLKDSKNCPCVAQEKMPCDYLGFIPGTMTCDPAPGTTNVTEWSKCSAF